jgi:Fe2+ or Zn2+ uptake regulation protein
MDHRGLHIRHSPCSAAALPETRTGSVEAFTDDALERVIDAVAERLGIELTGHDVVLRGTRR